MNFMAVRIVIDANPIIAALLGGKASNVVAANQFIFCSPQFTLFEIEKYVPLLARQLNRPEIDVRTTFHRLPITAYQPVAYAECVPHATALIGARDEDDVPVLALALELQVPIWTNDRDFVGLPEIQVYSTEDMVALLAS
jgi:predicted nucleic acid-binding protein